MRTALVQWKSTVAGSRRREGGKSKANVNQKESVSVVRTSQEEGGKVLSTRTKQPKANAASGPFLHVSKPLPRVLLLHTGGTLGMDPEISYNEIEGEATHLKAGTGGHYKTGLQPGALLQDLLQVVPELRVFANMDVKVMFNKDSSRVGPKEWAQLAKELHKMRDVYDAFVVVHGTDTLPFTASALSLMLAGFGKPIVLTGSQLPLAMPRSDARQNLIDSLTCATARFAPPHVNFREVGVCFGGKLMRGNRSQKVHTNQYMAFDSPTYPSLATLGVEVEWNERFLLLQHGYSAYRPRFKLDPNVIRIPIVPGTDPRKTYGDLFGRGVHGVVLEAFGVGNMDDRSSQGWIPWLRQQTKKGLSVYLTSQCTGGELHPELYKSGSVAMQMGVESGPQMTVECAVVKMMLCLAYPDLPLSQPIAGEL